MRLVPLLALGFAMAAAPWAAASPGLPDPALDCVGLPCDILNAVCQLLLGGGCVRAPALDCVGLPCDLINLVCEAAFGESCVA